MFLSFFDVFCAKFTINIFFEGKSGIVILHKMSRIFNGTEYYFAGG